MSALDRARLVEIAAEAVKRDRMNFDTGVTRSRSDAAAVVDALLAAIADDADLHASPDDAALDWFADRLRSLRTKEGP